MSNGSILAKGVQLCQRCGRILEHFESCDCWVRLPKDGLRASCPRFMARSGYRGKSYIACGDRKLRFDSRQERDQHYMKHCCNAFEKCKVHSAGCNHAGGAADHG